MKKKLMMVALLLGGLTLGACVDDNESASVTAVRNAKAEQLKAIGEAAKIQAEAARIQAEAEAALKQAQAAYQQELTEEAKQLFVLTLQQTEAAVKQAIAQMEAAVAVAKKQAANADSKRMATLYNAYAKALDDLADLNKKLAKAQASVAYKEAGVEYAKANAKSYIINENRNLAAAKARLEVLKNHANVDKKELYAAYSAKNKEKDLAQKDVYSKEGAALKAAGDAVKEAMEVADDANALINELNNLFDLDGDGTKDALIQTADFTTSGILYYYTSIEADYTSISNTYPMYVRVIEANKLKADRVVANAVKNASDALGTSADGKDKTTAYGKLAKAEADLTAEKAKPDTDTTKDVEGAEDKVAQAKDALAAAQKAYDDAVAVKEDYEAGIEGVPAIQEAMTLFAEAIEAQDAAEEVYNEATLRPAELAAEADALWDLYRNATNVDEMIVETEADIAYYEQQIVYYSSEYVADDEAALAKLKQKIEDYKQKIEAQNQVIEAAKAALDAALAE